MVRVIKFFAIFAWCALALFLVPRGILQQYQFLVSLGAREDGAIILMIIGAVGAVCSGIYLVGRIDG